MSALAAQTERAARRLAGRRAAGRSRRADEGAVTELARALLRDAHQLDGEPPWQPAPIATLRPAAQEETPAQAA
jgi:hypothetical protein